MVRLQPHKRRHSHARTCSADIRAERNRQTEMWSPGDQIHPIAMWLTILNVRLGKLSAEALSGDQSTPSAAMYGPDHLAAEERVALRRRAVQLAAVATALAEQLS